jgi:GTP-dependent phosphoenolpyruvate carboxykinase
MDIRSAIESTLRLSFVQVPKIYHVNWFRRDKNDKFLWPGFGDNIRVIDWIIRRIDGEPNIGQETAIGVVPTPGASICNMAHVFRLNQYGRT